MVSRDIHELLTESNKSIKEIMEELDFPSLSFFGKYVKKHLGKGPKEYRAAQLA
jgi:YesN/AraC family two-component response regulator